MYFSAYLVQDMVDYAIRNGMDLQQLDAQIPFNAISNPTGYVSYEHMVQLILVISEGLSDPHWGMALGKEMSLRGTAQVDQLMEYSASLEAAFENAAKYSKLISDALESSLVREGDTFRVSFEMHPGWAMQPLEAVKQITDMSLISTHLAIFRLTKRQYPALALHLNYPKPARINRYFRLFNCSILFNQPQAAIVFQSYVFDQSLPNQNPGLLQSLEIAALESLKQLNHESELIYLLQKHMLRQLPDKPSIEKAAVGLDRSVRTLQRQLSGLNTSFKRVEQEFKTTLAKYYLSATHKSIEEISYLLGFSESSAFIRFFKQMMKSTPKKYRLNSLRKTQ